MADYLSPGDVAERTGFSLFDDDRTVTRPRRAPGAVRGGARKPKL
ncbi:hypothetical protein [Embleya sp. NBC_00896]|nr:hypothetical protein OG928_26290 [Embleya sp. NBC_00896]